jgi:hypothetical protein
MLSVGTMIRKYFLGSEHSSITASSSYVSLICWTQQWMSLVKESPHDLALTQVMATQVSEWILESLWAPYRCGFHHLRESDRQQTGQPPLVGYHPPRLAPSDHR